MSETHFTAVPAGWYVDPSGLPQHRWWDGHQWTHDVTPMKQDLATLPAPQFGSYSQPQAVPARREAEPALVALPATATQPMTTFPTRRQLRREFEEAEAARRAAEEAAAPHPAAPFAMPSADAAPTPITPAAAPIDPTPLPVAAVAFAAAVAAPVIAPATAPATAQTAVPTAVHSAEPGVATTTRPLPLPLPTVIDPAPVAPTVQEASVAAQQPAAQLPATPLPAASWPFAAQAPATSAATTSELDPVSSMPYQPFGMIPKTSVGAIAAPERAQTVPVWFIVAMPVIMVAVAVAAVTLLPDYYTRFMQGGLLFVFALVTIALAVRDSRELRMAGHASPASPAWVLLTPLGYLIARSVRVRAETGRGTAPLWSWLVIVAAVVAAAVLLPDWLTRIDSASSLF